MFIKLCVLVIVLGASGAGVLSTRQARLVAAHEATEARLNTRSLERRTRELRIEIMRRVTPGALRERIDPDSVLVPSSERSTVLPPTEPEVQGEPEILWIDQHGRRVPDDILRHLSAIENDAP